MPRTRVDPLRRRRVAHACNSCKRRKEKCDGAAPCGQCTARRREETCIYTRPQASSDTAKPMLREERTRSTTSESEIHNALCALDDLAPLEEETLDPGNTFLTSAPVPKVSRMLRDSKGRFSRSLCPLEHGIENWVQLGLIQCSIRR